MNDDFRNTRLPANAERNNILARRKKRPLPDISDLLKSLEKDFKIQFFRLQDIPHAVAWAERGNIAIHENYHSRRKQSYHVICGEKENLERFCNRVGLSENYITASEFFRFWHLTWFPDTQKPPNCQATSGKSQGLTYIHPSR